MRFAAAAAGAFLLASGCAEIGLEPAGLPPPLPPRPVLRAERAPSATFGDGLIAHRRVDGVKLEVLVVGEGRAGAFPNATVIVSSKAWFNSRRRLIDGGLPDPRAFIPEERMELIDFYNAKPFGPFEHGKDLLGDGTLILVDMEGGAVGGLGLWLNLESGPVLLPGPAAFVYDNVFDGALPDRKFVVDISSFSWNVRAMRLAQEAVPRLLVIPAHDLSTLKLSHHPDVLLAP